MNVLLIDHEDSFVYNLYQALAQLGAKVTCVRYTTPWSRVRPLDPDVIVFSPGPGHPSDLRVTGLARRSLREWGGDRPILGVCLGHQLLGESFGARVIRAPRPVHGEVARVEHDATGILRGIPSPFWAARYHSLVVDGRSLPPELVITAKSSDRIIMGIRHTSEPTYGVQFHPESFLSPEGPNILQNLLEEAHR